jgi:hypothetical protein
MSRKSPAVTLLWMYTGKNAPARRQQIRAWGHDDLTVVEADPKAGWSRPIQGLTKDSDIYVFWMDDDKPVCGDFLNQMIQPLITRAEFGVVMHFWSGNAVSILRKTFETCPIADQEDEASSLLKLLIPILDAADKRSGGRIRLALSSTERLAPLTMEPVGFPS